MIRNFVKALVLLVLLAFLSVPVMAESWVLLGAQDGSMYTVDLSSAKMISDGEHSAIEGQFKKDGEQFTAQISLRACVLAGNGDLLFVNVAHPDDAPHTWNVTGSDIYSKMGGKLCQYGIEKLNKDSLNTNHPDNWKPLTVDSSGATWQINTTSAGIIYNKNGQLFSIGDFRNVTENTPMIATILLKECLIDGKGVLALAPPQKPTEITYEKWTSNGTLMKDMLGQKLCNYAQAKIGK